MEATIDDLLHIIGTLTVENKLLRRQLAQMQAQLVQPVQKENNKEVELQIDNNNKQ